MKHLRITRLVCGGILSIASSALLAQTSSSDPSSTSQSPSLGQSSDSSSLGSSSSLGLNRSSLSSGNNIRLSNIMNTTVQSQEGKTLGYLRDLVIDPQSGR